MNLMNKAPKEIDKEIKHWDVLLFKKLFSKSLDEWRIELYAKFEDKKANFNDVKDLDCSLFEGLFDSFLTRPFLLDTNDFTYLIKFCLSLRH